MIDLYKDDAEGLVYAFFDTHKLRESVAHEALPMLFDRASGKCGEWTDPLGR